MSPREEALAALAYDIAEDNLKHRKVNLGYVLDQVLDEPFVSNDEAAMLLFGDPEHKADAEMRLRNQAREIVMRWLESEPEGMALVDERIERDAQRMREEEDEREEPEGAAA